MKTFYFITFVILSLLIVAGYTDSIIYLSYKYILVLKGFWFYTAIAIVLFINKMFIIEFMKLLRALLSKLNTYGHKGRSFIIFPAWIYFLYWIYGLIKIVIQNPSSKPILLAVMVIIMMITMIANFCHDVDNELEES